MMQKKSQGGISDCSSQLSVSIGAKRGELSKSAICPTEFLKQGKYDLQHLSAHPSTLDSEKRIYDYFESRNIMPIDIKAFLDDVRGYKAQNAEIKCFEPPTP